jgi:phage terminase large subunit
VIKFPKKFQFLFEDWRFKVAHGGRSGLKSWQFARALLIKGLQRPVRIVCGREILKSIDDSVHDLMKQQIDILGKLDPRIKDNYIPKRNKIDAVNGTSISYVGLYANINNIKSYNDVDYFWCEEAENNSQESWDVLEPTIRKVVCKCHYEPVIVDVNKDIFCSITNKQLQDNKDDLWKSEIWVSFNPKRDDDPTMEMFINTIQPDSHVIYTSYRDNRWFDISPNKAKMEMMKKTNYSKYLHVWEGQPITDYDTLVYRYKHDVNCTGSTLKYNEGIETWTGWDFGVADDTAILFFQIVKVYPDDEFPMGYRINVYDEYVNNNKKADHYRDIVDSKRYLIDRHACDPSGINRAADLDSWIDKLKKNPLKNNIDWHFVYTHKYSPTEMIDNANDWIHAIRYNQHQVPHFHKMLRHWQYRTDKDGKVVLPPKPNHDEYSHVGTALYYFLINRFPPKNKAKIRVLK